MIPRATSRDTLWAKEAFKLSSCARLFKAWANRVTDSPLLLPFDAPIVKLESRLASPPPPLKTELTAPRKAFSCLASNPKDRAKLWATLFTVPALSAREL